MDDRIDALESDDLVLAGEGNDAVLGGDGDVSGAQKDLNLVAANSGLWRLAA